MFLLQLAIGLIQWINLNCSQNDGKYLKNDVSWSGICESVRMSSDESLWCSDQLLVERFVQRSDVCRQLLEHRCARDRTEHFEGHTCRTCRTCRTLLAEILVALVLPLDVHPREAPERAHSITGAAPNSAHTRTLVTAMHKSRVLFTDCTAPSHYYGASFVSINYTCTF